MQKPQKRTERLLEKYEKLKAKVQQFGSIEIKCPSCKAEMMISDLEFCECEAICCVDCRVYGEDCTLCPKCQRELIGATA